ncbi:ThiF family adenylyltransferase [Flavobacterium sp. LS1P28]|uniref:ThiF family adenylyltransferase n=1 Tax=Flavobacterium sp. LS1P28 TaxID=2497752 RepID=UPI000F84B33A|nr:ThiF family adenylyltransferase [Flavobacterium sp. LS1P28]RTY85400.1 ThiF family adenylyltransferase [Flavobacterium sp. LS1P28]
MNYGVAMTESVNKALFKHLIRKDGQEDLCFAFYKLASGKKRTVGIINKIILPETGDRNVQGNVSFNSEYLDKVTAYALTNSYGICFIHSHPFPGWQGMSYDDIEAETMLAPRVKAVTGLPLIGLTLGTDNTWSARFWIKAAPKKFESFWCESVRVVGKQLKLSYCEKLLPSQTFGEEFKRTVSSWGEAKQNDISRLKVGIIGLGSVGSLLAEALMRTGIKNLTFIDFDTIERKNLDRLLSASVQDIGKFKVDFQRDRLLSTGVISDLQILALRNSISEIEGYEAAIDCDILFSCVDRPLPRFILDCISYANLIPTIDGGVDTNPKPDMSNIDQARWKAHTTGPERICMKCLHQYKPEDVALQQSGLLEEPSYIKGLPKDHFIHRGENVFGFSLSLAGMEIQQFLSLILKPRGFYYGPKEMDFITGTIDSAFENECSGNCDIKQLLGKADEIKFQMISNDIAAEKIREKYSFSEVKLLNKKNLLKKVKDFD